MGKKLNRAVRRALKDAVRDAYHAGQVDTFRDVLPALGDLVHMAERDLSDEICKHLLFEVTP